MLLVLWGHVDRVDKPFFIITGAFKMPLFFAISGYLFKDRGGDVKAFLIKIFRTMVVPWFVLSLVWLKVIYALVRGKARLIPVYLYNFISGKDFWFMPCIILAEIFFFLIMKFISNTYLRYLAMLVISICGIVLGELGLGRFAMFGVACTSQIFLMFGYWFKNNEEALRRRLTLKITGLLACAYVVLVLIGMKLYPGETIDVHTGKYFNYPLCFLMSFVSLLVLFLAAPYVKIKLRWLNFVGRNTIVFYIVHYHARRVLSFGTGKLGFSIPKTLPWFLLIYLYICVSMSIAAFILQRWFPFILGRKKQKTEKA